MSIFFENESGKELDFDWKKLLTSVIEAALEQENCPYEAEVNVTLTDEEGIRELNREQRGIDRVTDVLSFPMLEYETPSDFSFIREEDNLLFHPESGELILGDIVLCLPRAESQAEEYGHSLRREMAFLTAHSMMHLFGHDHMEEEERLLMEEKQEQVLIGLGITRKERADRYE